MALSQRLAEQPGIYFGTGDGVESGPFVARIEVRVLPNGGASIHYEATSREQGVQHREHSLLVGESDGRDRLLIAHTESPFITDLFESTPGTGRFEQPAPHGPFVMAVVIEQPADDQITYAWWWAAAGAEPTEQSKASTRRI